ncbi:hypothetical protein Q5Y75_24820 [Ruegeria sp. 2205SS24-7]|uniref:hypothetical protein n=1 Tax=Ruegeria discodermiae TaxID=3064389 RepID=UPI0027414012|nr:hypothetical protein [Ruegeria sp. 2205SS24-7]MDP5220413.1 hypothetical protein [Ruegeria sp. 2205SS24-7]
MIVSIVRNPITGVAADGSGTFHLENALTRMALPFEGDGYTHATQGLLHRRGG